MQLKTLMDGVLLAVVMLTGCGGTELTEETPVELGTREDAINECLVGSPQGASCGGGGTCVADYPGDTSPACRPRCGAGTFGCATSEKCCPGFESPTGGITNPYCLPKTRTCVPSPVIE
ncbi:hypothetical protein ACLESD_03755 [Pyxidicoccus sp. 3LFB2]